MDDERQHNPAPRRGGFFVKLALLSVAVSAVPLLGVGAQVLDVNHDALAAKVRDHQAAISIDVAGSLERTLAEARVGLTAISDVLTDESVPEDARVSLASALVTTSPVLDHVAIYDARGEHVDTLKRAVFAAAPLIAARIDPPQAKAAAEPLGVARLDEEGRPRILVSLPIQANGRVTGAVVSWVSLRGLEAATARLFQVALGAQGESLYVVDSIGRLLARAPVPARGLEQAASPVIAGMGALSSFNTGFVRYGEVEGASGPLVATVISLPAVGVGVVVEQPRDAVYASLNEVRRTVAVALALAVVVALLLSLFLSSRLTRPIAELAAFADKLGRRQWGERVHIATRDELATLGSALNGAAEQLSASETALEHERKVRSELGRFLPKPVVDRVALQGGNVALAGQSTPITVMFADVVGFTRFSSTHSPEQVVRLLNELFSILTEIVFRNGGTVDKFIGDSVMAFWGAPEAITDHAERAVRTGREMLRFLETANEMWKQTYGTEIQLAIGISSGPAVVGNIGSSSRLEYTAIGATVNLAAALERIARPQQILCAASTVSAIRPEHGLTFYELGDREVAGLAAPVKLYTLADT